MVAAEHLERGDPSRGLGRTPRQARLLDPWSCESRTSGKRTSAVVIPHTPSGPQPYSLPVGSPRSACGYGAGYAVSEARSFRIQAAVGPRPRPACGGAFARPRAAASG